MDALDRSGPVHDELLERDGELNALERLIATAAAGHGRLALIEGPAGIGKSRLLDEARIRAAGRMTVLRARCSELESDFSFGAVRQLFEEAAQVPAPAAGVLALAGAGAEESGDPQGSFAALHGLHRTTRELAAQRPLLLSIDDLQWCDQPSLHFVAYLLRRLEDTPALVVATLRSTDPGTDPRVISEIATDPLTETIHPAPLGDAAVSAMVRARLGGAVDARFSAACTTATGGNPLLLRELLIALAEQRVRPLATEAGAVREIGSRAVARSVLRRLARLPQDAVAVARAVATLGESASTPAVAALAGLDEPAVAQAVAALAQADILRRDPPLGFVHPLVRDAVYRDASPGERELAHARAATVLTAARAAPEEIAAQLMHAPRRGAPETVELLRGAARRAQSRGGPQSAVAYLARALAEPPSPGVRSSVLLELGLAESDMNAGAAAGHLREAYELVTDPFVRATVGATLAQTMLFAGDAEEAGELARRIAAELPADLDDARAGMEAIELLTVVFGARNPSAVARAAAYEGLPRGAGTGARALAAQTAFHWAAGDRPPAEGEALALDALADPTTLESGHGLTWSAALSALSLTDSPRTMEYLDAVRAEAYRRGSTFSALTAELWRGYHLLHVGRLEPAGAAARQAVELMQRWDTQEIGSSWGRALVCRHALAVGDAGAARAALATPPSDDNESEGAMLWRGAHAELLLAEGRPREALAVTELMERTTLHVHHPDCKPWQSLAARALAALGRREEALAAMRAELERACRCAPPSTVGRCLRELGELEGAAGLPHLHEAAEQLAQTPARLEHARALAALGGALCDAGRASDGDGPLRRALALAETCGCPPLVAQVRARLGDD